MVQVIDLIKTGDINATRSGWEEVCRFLSMQPGFVAGELLETFKTVHPRAGYELISFCQWQSEEAWQAARRLVREDARLAQTLAATPAKFVGFKGSLCAGAGYDVEAGSAGSMVLFDLVYLDEPRMDGYVQMWTRAKAFMRKHAAYQSASLYRTNDTANAIKYINVAQWRTSEEFFNALNTPEFLAILGEYADDFSLYLSKSALCVLARPSVVAQAEGSQ
jgi:heme-degrading monooxygenase HmoA